jgi:hypothetical protein
MYEYIISYLGLLVGLVLAYFTKDEVKRGVNYLSWIAKVLLFSIALIFLITNFHWWSALIGLVIGVFLYAPYLYLGLGITPGVLIPSLIFIFGLLKGSLIWIRENKHWYWWSALMLMAGILITWLSGLNLSSLAGGALLGMLIKRAVKSFK